jgi:pyruvate,orthophosphate dikinase
LDATNSKWETHPAAMVRIAIELLAEGRIDEKQALLMQEPSKLEELLHPVFDISAIKMLLF